MFDPVDAMAPDAPILHDKGLAEKGNVYVDIHGEVGSVADGFAAADVVHEKTYSTSRVQHVHLETHGSIAWRDADGRLHVRTSSQAPFIAQQKLCHLFGLKTRDVHVFTERVGGGFGGKQEMISEDLCVLATLKTGRPVKWEFTREEQFIGATTRHQMTTRVKLGAKRDGTLTAIEVHVVSNTGAYGGHAGETLAAALGSPLTSIAAPTRRRPATRSTPTWSRRAASAATARRRRPSPSNARSTSWHGCSASGPFEIRRKNMIRPGDWMKSVWKDPSDVDFGSYGLDQCLDLVEKALAQRQRRSQAGGRRLGGRHRHRAGDARLRTADRAPRRVGDDAAARWQLSPRGRLDRDGQRLGDLAPADRGVRARRRAPAAWRSSMPTPISRPTIPALSPAPARWSPARRWR